MVTTSFVSTFRMSGSSNTSSPSETTPAKSAGWPADGSGRISRSMGGVSHRNEFEKVKFTRPPRLTLRPLTMPSTAKAILPRNGTS